MSSKDCGSHGDRRRKIARRICVGLLFFNFILLLTILIIWAVLQPSKPRFILEDVTVYAFNTSVPNFLTTNFQVTLSSRNPNNRIGVYYDRLDVYANYHNQQITFRTGIPPRENGGNARKRRNAEEDSPKGVSTSSGNGVSDFEGKLLKTSACKDDNHEPKAEAEYGAGKPVEQNNPLPDQPKQDYIHVRARRGQATDSHSLAERARREKISERMKILQDLVPGCNKVIGKAMVLDEIINYIQSLQSQVEFLSMKLEAVNSRINPAIDIFPPKDFSQQTFGTSVMAYPSQLAREFSRGSSPEWLHMQVGGGFEKPT